MHLNIKTRISVTFCSLFSRNAENIPKNMKPSKVTCALFTAVKRFELACRYEYMYNLYRTILGVVYLW